jgi:L-histidine N-alpha-methyltransferase
MPTRRPARALAAQDPLLTIERLLGPSHRTTLERDVRRGLSSRPKSLPSKYFYDERGSRLFEAICDLPEYYLTRADTALLRRHADDLVARVRPTDVIELGSGAATKTRFILDALVRQGRGDARYVPMDVSESHLVQTAESVRQEYPELSVHGIAGDYEHHLDRIPSGERRLVLFLGSTIGNFPPAAARAFVRRVARQLVPGDAFLIGMDLVKPPEILHAAYNDSAGLTAEFNRNVLYVLNRELGADFAPDDFEHVAFYDPESARVEMHLRASRAHRVHVRRLALDVEFEAGEMIHTEISRKFRRADAEALFSAAGCRLAEWWTDDRESFAEALGVR